MKHLLVVDVELTEENKPICKDDNNRCPLWNEEISFCMYNFNNNTKGCPLKPLPKGHGRLGDLDALEKEMIGGIRAGNFEEGYETFTHINDVDDCVECVKYAPTIEEGEEKWEQY